MSLLAELSPAKGSTKRRKVLGRGVGSGRGGTSTKGHKGQKARTGGKVRWGFEGGQMPLHRRLPKFGFTNASFKTTYAILNLDKLNNWDKEVTPEILTEQGFLKAGERLKILGNGKIEKALKVKAHKFSKTAKEAIEKAGGTVEVI
jgi:large subunit ribosomal protein L15